MYERYKMEKIEMVLDELQLLVFELELDGFKYLTDIQRMNIVNFKITLKKPPIDKDDALNILYNIIDKMKELKITEMLELEQTEHAVDIIYNNINKYMKNMDKEKFVLYDTNGGFN